LSDRGNEMKTISVGEAVSMIPNGASLKKSDILGIVEGKASVQAAT